MSTISKSGMTKKHRNLEKLSFVKIVTNMSRNMLGTTEMTLIIKILGNYGNDSHNKNLGDY